MTLPSLTDYHIGIDLDHTTYNPLPAICRETNKRHNTNLTPADITEYNLSVPGTDTTIVPVIYDLHDDPSFIRDMPLMPGAKNTLQELSDAGATLSVVTHREPHTFDWTRASLAKHNIPYDNFVEDVPDNKADLTELDILIDDLHSNVTGMADTNRDGILFLRPYNIDTIPTHERVHSALRNGHTPEQLLTNPATQWTEIKSLIRTITEVQGESP